MYKILGRLRAKFEVHVYVCADFSGVRQCKRRTVIFVYGCMCGSQIFAILTLCYF